MAKWEKLQYNSILQGDGFHISYNADTSIAVGAAFAADSGAGDETAICKDRDYKILNGDFRKEYEKLVDKGYDACVKFFEKQKDAQSTWSSQSEKLPPIFSMFT